MSIKQLTAFIIFLFFISDHAAGQDQPKTIYELFEIQEGGCDLSSSSKQSDGAMAESVPPPPPPPPLAAGASASGLSEEMIQSFSSIFKMAAKDNKEEWIEPRRNLSNGNYAFLLDNKWGVKNEKGKTIVEPRFTHLFGDTIAKGFCGYEGATCKYYDAFGKEKVSLAFYHMKPMSENTFIVHGKAGYGIVYNEKLIVEANAQYIEYKKHSNSYRVKYKDTKDKVYWNDFASSFSYPFDYRGYRILGMDHMLIADNLVNIKEKKKMICEEGYQVRVLDETQMIFSVQKRNDSAVFLSDAKGNLISNITYSSLQDFGKYLYAVAGVSKKTPGNRGKKSFYGLIDKKGNWVIEPTYASIWYSKGHYISTNKKGNRGYIDSSGRVKCEPIYKSLKSNKKGQYVGVKLIDGDKKVTQLLDEETGEMINENFSAESVNKIEICGKNYSRVKEGKKVKMLNHKQKPITAAHKKLTVWKDYIIAKDYPRFTNRKDTSIAYNCKGQKVALKVGKESYSEFKEVKTVLEGLDAIRLMDETCLLFDAKGNVQKIDYFPYQTSDFGLYGWTILKTSKSKTTLLDENNQVLFPLTLEYIGPFSKASGLMSYSINDNYKGMIDQNGDLVFGGMYQKVTRLSANVYMVMTNKKWGMVNADNEIMIPLEYNKFYIRDGLILMDKGGKRTYFDYTGKVVR